MGPLNPTRGYELRHELSLLDINVSEQAVAVSSVRAPIISSYNERIRPLLDVVDKLRHLKIMQEGIQLPTIVVVGDQSSGKSSVLESLSGITLPRGQGICTRVPLIMRLQSHNTPEPELFFEYDGKVVHTDEEHISEDIVSATDEIAGSGKGISNNPLTLIVRKIGVPDLTMVDLPGITRVPVHGQPEDIYEQISQIIMEFITPEESIILNVLSASVDFTTCESIRMSQRVDKTGERTLAVVTKADKSPEDLFEKVTADDVNIGLGYVCVRNRIGNETYEEARRAEVKLFESHPLLNKISKHAVGIPVLAERLMKIQASAIAKCLPDIIRKINEKLSNNMDELKKMPKHLTSISEAMTALMDILSSAKDSLRKILVHGDFEEYPDDPQMHCAARLAEMLSKYKDDLQVSRDRVKNTNDPKSFLLDEMSILEEAKAIGLPNFLPRSAFLTLLKRRVNDISMIPADFVENAWSYVEKVLIRVLMMHSDNYPQLLSGMRRAAQNLVAKKKQQSSDWVKDIVEMEKLTDYTCDQEYMSSWNKLMSDQDKLMTHIRAPSSYPGLEIDGFGSVKIDHLRAQQGLVQEAFDVKMRMVAYWDIVLKRMVDNMALHLLFRIQNLVNKEMQGEILEELIGPQGNGMERMLDEPPSVADKRQKLKKSVKLLKESKDVVARIMDRVVTDHAC